LRFFRRGAPPPQDPQLEAPEASEEIEAPVDGGPDADDLIGDEWQSATSEAVVDDVAPPQTEQPPDLPSATHGSAAVEPPTSVAPDLAVPEPQPEPEPEIQWAWGADWTAEKADAARREREQAALEAGLEKSRTGFGARLRSAFGTGDDADWDEI
jgi:hypothetical protein